MGELIDDYQPPADGVAEFLSAMWGHGPHSVCCFVPDQGFRFGFADKPVDPLDALGELQDFDTWIGAHPLRAKPTNGRGDEDDVLEVVAIPADLDWEHETRRTDKPLPTEAEVRDRLQRLGPHLQPSIVVHSGHGLQTWWLLTEPVSPDDARQLIAQLDAALAAVELENGRPDLASILRLPGTRNHKGDGEPVPVVIESFSSRCFPPEYLREHLPPAVAGRSGGGTKHRRGAVAAEQQELCDHVVARHGAHSVDVWRDGSMHVVRPGKLAKDGSSASIIVGDDGDALLTVFSDNWPLIGKRPGDTQPRSWGSRHRRRTPPPGRPDGEVHVQHPTGSDLDGGERAAQPARRVLDGPTGTGRVAALGAFAAAFRRRRVRHGTGTHRGAHPARADGRHGHRLPDVAQLADRRDRRQRGG
jgi:hypothetical protein